MDLSFTELLLLAPTIIGVFAVVAKYTPNTADDKLAQMLFDIINVLGQNAGKAKNAPDETPDTNITRIGT